MHVGISGRMSRTMHDGGPLMPMEKPIGFAAPMLPLSRASGFQNPCRPRTLGSGGDWRVSLTERPGIGA